MCIFVFGVNWCFWKFLMSDLQKKKICENFRGQFLLSRSDVIVVVCLPLKFQTYFPWAPQMHKHLVTMQSTQSAMLSHYGGTMNFKGQEIAHRPPPRPVWPHHPETDPWHIRVTNLAKGEAAKMLQQGQISWHQKAGASTCLVHKKIFVMGQCVPFN